MFLQLQMLPWLLRLLVQPLSSFDLMVVEKYDLQVIDVNTHVLHIYLIVLYLSDLLDRLIAYRRRERFRCDHFRQKAQLQALVG